MNLLERNGVGVGLPERIVEELPATGEGWIVTVYNNEHNSYEQVMTILMIATKCTSEEAFIEAWEIDNFGQCVVHRACQDECKSAADIIATIGIRVEVSPEN